MQNFTQAKADVHANLGIDAGLRDHMNRVYATMSIGLLITFLTAWSVGTSDLLLSFLMNTDPMTDTVAPNILGWIVMFAPLIMVFALSGTINRMSTSGVYLFFYAFSTVMGLSLSWIFSFFTGISIAQMFLVTSIAFAGLSLWGYTTKKDISQWGAFLMIGVIGLLVASIFNIFMGSPAIMFAVSSLGVLIFAGLTAYDTQSIKNEYIEHAAISDSTWLEKSGIMGALRLYLNFVNMFIFLLNLSGDTD